MDRKNLVERSVAQGKEYRTQNNLTVEGFAEAIQESKGVAQDILTGNRNRLPTLLQILKYEKLNEQDGTAPPPYRPLNWVYIITGKTLTRYESALEKRVHELEKENERLANELERATKTLIEKLEKLADQIH